MSNDSKLPEPGLISSKIAQYKAIKVSGDGDGDDSYSVDDDEIRHEENGGGAVAVDEVADSIDEEEEAFVEEELPEEPSERQTIDPPHKTFAPVIEVVPAESNKDEKGKTQVDAFGEQEPDETEEPVEIEKG